MSGSIPLIFFFVINFLKIFKICIGIPGANRSVLSFPLPPMKPVLQQTNWKPWNQAFTIEFLKNFKICIRIPGADRSVPSFPLPPMKPVLQQTNWSLEITRLPSNFSKILKFVSGNQERTGVYFSFSQLNFHRLFVNKSFVEHKNRSFGFNYIMPSSVLINWNEHKIYAQREWGCPLLGCK